MKKNTPPFKIGNWVTFEDTTDDWGATKIFIEKVTNIDFEFESLSSLNQIFFVDFNKVKLWTPVIGESVFTTMNFSFPEKFDNNLFPVLLKVEEQLDGNRFVLQNNVVKHISELCPFNGHLPTFED